MSTTIFARDLKPGDVIDFGGQPCVITEVGAATSHGSVLVSVAGLWRSDFESALTLAADLPLNVQRPDPDAELVEVMAQAAYLDDGCSPTGWPSTPASETYRGNIRAALSAAREAGLL